VDELRALVPAGARVLARIDSRAGVDRRAEIIATADTVVVGRSHLAAELPIEQVPFLQKAIAREGAAAGTPVWVATGRSGGTASVTATVAEANDVANLLLDGVSGLVLTGETAIGSDPFGAVERIARLLAGFEETAGRWAPAPGGARDGASARSSRWRAATRPMSAGSSRQRASGRRRRTPSPEQGASRSTRSKRPAPPAPAERIGRRRPSATSTCTEWSPRRRAASPMRAARPGRRSAATTSPSSPIASARAVAVPPGAAATR